MIGNKFLSVAGASEPTDPQFNYVTMLLHADGTNGAQNNTFIDGSTNNFTVTRVGNTTQGSFSPYGSNWSNYFTGAGASYIQYSSVPAMGTSDVTIEFWFFSGSDAVAYKCFYDTRDPAVSNSGFGIFQYGKTIEVYGTGLKVATASNAFIANVWVHCALVRTSGTCQLYINGVASGSSGAYSSNFTYTTRLLGIDAGITSSYNFAGYISNLREVKSALYSGTFTPSTTPLTNIANTSLLTCQSNNLVYNTSYSASIGETPYAVSVQRFNPFGTSTAYSTATIGGSGYFDGTSDYLTVGGTTSATLSGDFTIEFWGYPIATSGVQEWVSKEYGLQIYAQNGYWDVAISSSNSSTYFFNASPASPYQPYTWSHVAVTRSGNNYYLFVDGVQAGTTTNASAPSLGSTYPWTVGAWSSNPASSYWVNGYISDVRIVNGTALYTSAFTPPTAPLTAVTNTQILLNMQNAAIYDNAMMNDLETVGNAQISTSVKKYGTGSLAFDGTGDSLKGIAGSPSFQFGTGDFTIEMWVYTSNLAAYQTLLDTRAADSTTAYGLFIDNTGKPYWFDASGTQASSVGVSSNTWTHIAFVRTSGVLKIFVNGTSGYSSANTNSQNPTGNIVVGMNISGSAPYSGYIDDLRITKGYARYTTTFTPPTQALPDKGT